MKMYDFKSKESSSLEYFETEYSKFGSSAQRKYPNEELCRFLGRNFFQVPYLERKHIKILEVGCGSGGNLWAIAREGFQAIGIDISSKAIDLCADTLKSHNCSGELVVSSMDNLPTEFNDLDAVVDVFSSHCLNRREGEKFLMEVKRVLRSGGIFFSYFPSKNSDTWTKENANERGSEKFVDIDTLNGLRRTTGPFYGNFHPFRFLYPDQYQQLLEACGFKINRCETLNRSYFGQTEVFQFIVIEATKL